MNRLVVPFIALSLTAAAPSDSWHALRVFEGKWEGPTSGKPGTGTTTREYRFELNDRILTQRDKAVYQPDDKAAKLQVHEDFGVLSYDTQLEKIVWRQYHSEGIVNQYALQSVSADGKSIEFVTTKIENLAPGFRAKKLYRIVSDDEIEETFWLAAPGKDLEVYTLAHLKRVK